MRIEYCLNDDKLGLIYDPIIDYVKENLPTLKVLYKNYDEWNNSSTKKFLEDVKGMPVLFHLDNYVCRPGIENYLKGESKFTGYAVKFLDDDEITIITVEQCNNKFSMLESFIKSINTLKLDNIPVIYTGGGYVSCSNNECMLSRMIEKNPTFDVARIDHEVMERKRKEFAKQLGPELKAIDEWQAESARKLDKIRLKKQKF